MKKPNFREVGETLQKKDLKSTLKEEKVDETNNEVLSPKHAFSL